MRGWASVTLRRQLLSGADVDASFSPLKSWPGFYFLFFNAGGVWGSQGWFVDVCGTQTTRGLALVRQLSEQRSFEILTTSLLTIRKKSCSGRTFFWFLLHFQFWLPFLNWELFSLAQIVKEALDVKEQDALGTAFIHKNKPIWYFSFLSFFLFLLWLD